MSMNKVRQLVNHTMEAEFIPGVGEITGIGKFLRSEMALINTAAIPEQTAMDVLAMDHVKEQAVRSMYHYMYGDIRKLAMRLSYALDVSETSDEASHYIRELLKEIDGETNVRKPVW